MRTNHEKVFFNRAQVDNCEKTACANCGERLIFALRDSRGEEFTVGLSLILKCLKQAQQQQCVPELPQEWWKKLISYYSYNELEV